MIRFGPRPVSSATIIAGLSAGANGDKLFYDQSVDAFKVAYSAGYGAQLRYNGITTRSSGLIGWSSTNSAEGTADVTLFRDAAHTLAQRNGTNAQTFRLYNTFTDTLNYERLGVRMASGAFNIGPEWTGTGLPRPLWLSHGSTIISLEDSAGPGGASVGVKRDGTSAVTIFAVGSTGLTSTTLLHTRLMPSINQVSGTYTILDINPTETAIGAGPHYLIRGRIGASADVFGVTNAGSIQWGGAVVGAPMLKRSAATLQLRLGDDSAFASFRCLGITVDSSAAMITSGVAFNNGAAAAAGTLTNAPIAGNPTKWIPINDNGTLRYIPAW